MNGPVDPSNRRLRRQGIEWAARFTARTARVVAACMFRRWRDRVRAPFEDLFARMPAPERDALARRHWLYRAEYLAAQMRLGWLEPQELREFCLTRVDLEGFGELENVSPGEAVVAFSAHYGHFLLATLCLILRSPKHMRIHILYNAPPVTGLLPTVQELLPMLGRPVESIHIDHAGTLRALRALRRGDLVILLADHVPFDGSEIHIPFLGRLMTAMRGTAFLALRSNARLLPFYGFLRGRDRFTVRVEPSLRLARTGSEEQDLYETTAGVFASIERQVLAHPEQWLFWDRVMGQIAENVAPPAGREDTGLQLERLAEGLDASQTPAAALIQRVAAELRGSRSGVA